MRRYTVRHFFTMFVLLALPAATCGVSAAVQDLRDRVAVLEAESDAEFVVVDSVGAQVGEFVGIDVTDAGLPVVLFDFEGLRPFFLSVEPNRFLSSIGSLRFASTDCSGTPLLQPSIISEGVMHPVFYQENSGQTYAAPATGTMTTVLSRIDHTGGCDSVNQTLEFGDAILVPGTEDFIPPFQLITRGEFLDMQEGN